MADRNCRRLSVFVSTPAMHTVPDVGLMRSSAPKRDDLPAPVLPTMPIFSPLRILKSSPLSTGVPVVSYHMRRPAAVMAPSRGHDGVCSVEAFAVCSGACRGTVLGMLCVLVVLLTLLSVRCVASIALISSTSLARPPPYSTSRSADVSWFSTSADCRTIH